MNENQIKEIYKLADLLETVTNKDDELFETSIKLDQHKYLIQLEPLEYARVVAKAVANELIEILNMEVE
ncbi:hypothetical protein [Macrococcus animalis]|uniref:hypothetical protein n=1 Tax=Macrococcus animalis TaxID=3395467 RepID=UPI0039BDFDE0